MSNLLAVISPAKTLDDQSHYPGLSCTQPIFSEEAAQLVKKLKPLSGTKLSALMDISAALGEENARRYAQWHLPFTHQTAHPALLMFKGDVYRGLQAQELGEPDLKFATDNLRIISGLYGLLRPLDLVMPYRLMMATPFAHSTKHKNLYAFWGTKIALQLHQEIEPRGTLVNLASSEYFKAIDSKTLDRAVVHCEFREKKGADYKIVSTFAKLARGKMARFLIDHRITKKKDLKAFDTDGYSFHPQFSNDETFVFTRG